MTSFAFILRGVPLMIGSGAGFAGMLGVTLFGIFLTPVFFYVIQGMTRQPRPIDDPQSVGGNLNDPSRVVKA